MSTLGPLAPTTASGWGTSNNALALDGAYATAVCQTVNDVSTGFNAVFTPTSNLILGGFGASIAAGNEARGFTVSITLLANPNAAGANGNIYLALGGSIVGSAKTVTITGSAQTITLGSATDVWGGSWVSTDIPNLQIIFYANSTSFGTAASTVQVDYVNVTITHFDVTPAAFSFTGVTGATLNTDYTASVTITGMDAGVDITPLVQFAKSYVVRDLAKVRPNGSVVYNNCILDLTVTSPSAYGGYTNGRVTISGVIGVFGIYAIPATTTPNNFTFPSATGVAINSTQTSATNTLSGTNTAVTGTITNGLMSVNGAAFTSSATSFPPGCTFAVQHSASPTGSTSVVTTLTINGVVGTFTSTTAATVSTTPNAFTFATNAGAQLSVLQTSASITPTGTTTGTGISVSGGSYSLNGGAFVTTAGTYNPGDTVRAQNTSSASFTTSVVTTVTIGGVAGTFTSTTRAPNLNPNQFTFTAVTGAAVSTVFTSNTVTMAGLEGTANYSTTINGGTGHQVSVNGGAYVSAATGTISNGQTIILRLTSAAAVSIQASLTLTVNGTVSSTYSVTTAAVTAPSAITFVAQTQVQPGSVITSAGVTLAGAMTTALATSTNATFDVNASGTFVTTASVANADVIRLRLNASLAGGGVVSGAFTVSGVTGNFSATTRYSAVFFDF